MSDERQNLPIDEVSRGAEQNDDELSLPEEVRANLRILAKRRALLRDEKWRALARGTISPDELEELEREAKKSPEAQALLDLARPKNLARPKLAQRTIVRRVGAALLLAAGIGAIWLGMKSNPAPVSATYPPMPSYTMKVEGGLAKTLGSESDKHYTLPSDASTSIEIALTPPPTMLVSRYGKLSGRAFIFRFGTLQPLDLPIAVDDSGKTVIQGNRNQLFPNVPNGVYELWIVVGPEAEVSKDPGKILEQADKTERSVSISRITVELVGESSALPPLLDVRFADCSEIITETNIESSLPACVLEPEGKLELRLKAPTGARLRGRVDDKPIQEDLELATTPAGHTIVIPVRSRYAVVEIDAMLGDRHAAFRLPLRQAQGAGQLGQSPSPDQRSNRETELKHAIASADPIVRARAYGVLGRIERDEKQYAAAIDDMKTAIELDRSTGRLSAEFADRIALSEIYSEHLHDRTKALAELKKLDYFRSRLPDSLIKIPYYRALTAARSGDLRTALRLYDETWLLANEQGHEDMIEDTKFALSEIFVKLGRFREARKLKEEFRDLAKGQTESACFAADTENQAGWVEYLASFVPSNDTDALKDAEDHFRKALGKECDKGYVRANIRTNLALVALAQANFDAARVYIAEAKKDIGVEDTSLAQWWELVESRLLIAEAGNDAANAKLALGKLEKLIERAEDAEVRLDAWLARAEAYDALGDDAARQAYKEADVDALRYALSVELTTGAGAFMAVHGRTTERRIDYLLRLAEKKPQQSREILQEAVEAARGSRLRVFASLPGRVAIEDSLETRRDKLQNAVQPAIAEEDGKSETVTSFRARQEMVRQAFDDVLKSIGISADAPISTSALGELTLTYHLLNDGYVGFAIDENGRIVAKRLDFHSSEKLSVQEISFRVLEPFRKQISRAKRIRLAPHGAALAIVDFHALPWDEGVLIEAVPLAYAVDFGTSQPAVDTKEPGAAPEALVVLGDPLGTLPGAKFEAESVANWLHDRHGYKVTQSETSRKQGVEAFRTSLVGNDIRLLHFVGHGEYDRLAPEEKDVVIYRPDLDGWDSGLHLGDDSLFTPRYVMTLPRVPSYVVLSACEVGSMADKVQGLSFGLPHAFIAKGTRAVVAATVPLKVKANDAKNSLHVKFMEKLMNSTAFPNDMSAAWRDAVVQLFNDKAVAEEIKNEWPAFRVFVA